MNHKIRYKDRSTENYEFIHLIAKHYVPALKESIDVVRTLEENGIREWELIAEYQKCQD